MKKKIMIGGIIVIFMLVTISFASAINTNNINAERKESPLYKIRTELAIKEKIGKIFVLIKTRFLGERIFFIPIEWIKQKIFPDIMDQTLEGSKLRICIDSMKRNACCITDSVV